MIAILPLCILRYVHNLVKGTFSTITNDHVADFAFVCCVEERLGRPLVRRGFLNGWYRKLWTLASVDRIFWPLILYAIYLTFGPWSIGYLVEDHLGAIFAWGIFVNGSFLPGSFTYLYGFLQVNKTDQGQDL